MVHLQESTDCDDNSNAFPQENTPAAELICPWIKAGISQLHVILASGDMIQVAEYGSGTGGTTIDPLNVMLKTLKQHTSSVDTGTGTPMTRYHCS